MNWQELLKWALLILLAIWLINSISGWILEWVPEWIPRDWILPLILGVLGIAFIIYKIFKRR